MPASAPSKPGRTCPNCHAFVPAGRRTCLACRLEVSKMDGFLAAKNAAKKRGFASTQVENSGPPFFLRPGFIVKTVLLLAVIGLVAYYFRPRPPRYLMFPNTPTAAVQQFLQDISGGQDPDFDKAYALVPDSVRDPKNSDEHSDYVQIFDEMNKYFSNEFGPDWYTQTQLAPDAKDPNIIVAKVALETIHIHTADAVPAGKKAQDGAHFGVTAIDEFNVSWAAEFRQMEGLFAALKVVSYGDSAGGENLKAIMGTGESNRHDPPMIKKIRVLEVLRNPRAINYRDVVQAYPFRTDPVVQNRLKMITTDTRYDLRGARCRPADPRQPRRHARPAQRRSRLRVTLTSPAGWIPRARERVSRASPKEKTAVSSG